MSQVSPAAPVIFGADPFWVAIAVFSLTYLLVITDRINRSILALLGAGVMVASGVLSQEEAIRGIDFNTIALLTGMMVLVAIARRCGMFEYLAVWSAKMGRAQPWAILAMLSLVTAILSAFLDNVTTVLLVAPVTLEIARYLEAPPYPFLFAEVFASNIGGTATLIGDPPNIIIGSAAHLSFNDFVVNLTPVIVVILVVQVVATHLIWGRKMRAVPAARARIMALDPRELITDLPLMRTSLLVIGGVIAAFVLAEPLHLQPGTIALFGAAILMLLHNIEHHREREKQTLRVTETFNEVDWITIFFFLGLFVIVHGIDVAGVLDLAAKQLLSLTGGNPTTTTIAILWGSAVLSAIVDNIPFVAAMIPLIRELAPHFGGAEQIMPLWWALSLGACLGGNGTLIGASANLALAGIAERSGVEFRFLTFLRYGFGLMLLSVAISNVYLWLRYL
ncbi:MAG TPA: ArsB/NhaD family transporter [Stellaceae bacterium]|jgi:Na+/H+ antiporter NhaD/arsenite permease-like protein|nr:ArsB/NhaD family transporter [Stellaceae bacterium]